MVNLVTTNNEDVSYINPYQISSMDRIANTYYIVMNNGTRYCTDKESFEKVLKMLSDD